MPKTKNPIVAAILGLLFGPFGYLYIAWTYAIATFLVVVLFAIIVAILGFWISPWVKFLILPVMAWRAHKIVCIRNDIIESGHEVPALNSFPFAVMAAVTVMVYVGMAWGGFLGFQLGVEKLLDGSIIRGLFTILITTPIFALISKFLFKFIAAGIEMLFARDSDNVFFPS